MTQAGDRILNRVTKVTHVTGICITVDNSDIPVTERHLSHMEQRDQALIIMFDKIGYDAQKECKFEFFIQRFAED